ncbi:MAG: alpha/beta hydrolase family protein [Armatimonadota bacterium]
MSSETAFRTEQFYTTLDYFRARFDQFSRQLGLKAKDTAEFAAWKVQLRGELSALIGLPTMVRCDGDPQVVERVELDEYVREKVLLQTEPGVWMPVYVLIPGDLQPGEQRPAMIAPHGHASGGKFSVAGRTDIPLIAKQVAEYNYAYGVAMVKAGFVVFCPDARGFGERRELALQAEENLLISSCTDLNHMAYPLGQTVTGMWTWDLMRLADYVEQRPECDANRLGCAGLSGGGLQTLWFTAMDDRVQCAVVSGYFYGYKESLLDMSQNCSCNYVPGLWEKVDMGDLGALIAPRPLLIETGDIDPLNGSGLENVTSQLAITRQAYDLFGTGDRLAHHVFPGPHRWCGEKALPWLTTHLMGA